MHVLQEPAPIATSLLIDAALVRKYDQAGPRYISYPPTDRFIEAYGVRAHRTTLHQRSVRWGPATNIQPLSLHVHVPLRKTVLAQGSDNEAGIRSHGRSVRYLYYLDREFSLVAGMLEGSRCADQVRLGGGMPALLSCEELRTLLRSLGTHFELLAGEYAVEIDPRTVDDEKITALGQLGFNRLTLGVQDFTEDARHAINGIQSEEATSRAAEVARKHGFTSISVELTYALPGQTVFGFDRALDQMLALKPDRVALYHYTPLPKPQGSTDAALPTAEARLQILVHAIHKLTGAGYRYIGMDHFVLPHDELAIAASHAGLRRNLQGYSTHPDNDQIGFGIAVISKVGATYSQNVTSTGEYYERLDRDELPVWRGIELRADDLLRRAVMQSLMCHFELSIESIEIAHLIRFDDYFADELLRLTVLAGEDLVALEPGWITVTPRGRLLVRTIAMVFDRYLSRGEQRERYSNVI